jgi:hypothetical protein
MSFTGDLEHLPIVDVIQLLHATKKSGTLSVRGRKGESQLVFDGGYIISANHLDDSLRIGKILVETRAITPVHLQQALQDQKTAGVSRKPLIAMLIERGQVRKEDAFKALETLIELTIVEILTWVTGTFSLDVDNLAVSDEYRYFPENLHQEILLNTQSVLMDALRIYDEKKRDGELGEEDAAATPAAVEAASGGAEESWELSAEDLGLGDFERLERKIPGVFSSLADIDPVESQRQKLRAFAPELSAAELEELLAFLLKFSGRAVADAADSPEARVLILFSADELFTHAVTTVCKHDGLPVFATNDKQDLDHIIDQSLAKEIAPILVLDSPADSAEAGGAAATAELRRQKKEKFPQLAIIQLASPLAYEFTLRAFADGVRAVLPRPQRTARAQTFVADTILFLEAFCRYLKGAAGPPAEDPFAQLGKELAALGGRRHGDDVAGCRDVRAHGLPDVSQDFGQLPHDRGHVAPVRFQPGADQQQVFPLRKFHRLLAAHQHLLEGLPAEGVFQPGLLPAQQEDERNRRADLRDADRVLRDVGVALLPVVLDPRELPGDLAGHRVLVDHGAAGAGQHALRE